MPKADLSVIWQQLPSELPKDAFVAHVKFKDPSAGWSELQKGTRAQVNRVVQGKFKGKEVIVRDTVEIRITCYAPLRFGGSGYIIGKPIGYERGVLILQPIFKPAA